MHPFKTFNVIVLTSVCAVVVTLISFGRHFQDSAAVDYFATLRESSEAGCQSFFARKPEVFILGDSHSYTAWAFEKVADFFHTPRLSSCTMGGLYFSSGALILESMFKKRLFPKVVIYGASLRQFVIGKNKGKQLQAHRQLMDEASKSLGDSMNFLSTSKALIRFAGRKVLGARGATMSALRSPAEKLDAAFQAHVDAIEKLPEDVVAQRMRENPHDGSKLWKEFMTNLRFDPNEIEKIHEVCGWIKNSSTRLVVVPVPESPFLEATYPPEALKQYDEILKRFSECATVVRDDRHFGIGNRHFVNRKLSPRFSYNHWTSDYDLDHMNLVGARRFTARVLEHLRAF